MSGLDIQRALFYTAEDVAAMLGKNVRYVYRHANGRGFLAPYAKRFNAKLLLFRREEIDRLLAEGPTAERRRP